MYSVDCQWCLGRSTPFLFWSIHTLFTALKWCGSTKTKKGVDRQRHHWRSTLYLSTIFLFLDKNFKFIFWKGHKSSRFREIYSNFVAFSQMINLGSNKVGRFFQIFTAFSECMFFSKINTLSCQINECTRLAFQIFPYPPCTFSTQLD